MDSDPSRPSSCGFTLIELLIVVSVLGILAAIAIPSLLRSRISANEASAIGSLRIIASAQIDFNTNSSGAHSFADSLEVLNTADGAGGVQFIDDHLATGLKAGYRFFIQAGDFQYAAYFSWSAEAHPVLYQRTGVLSFYTDESGIVLGFDQMGGPGLSTMPALR